ncbi:hypothetical protein NT6N_37650 [Oceaniferula spumae]|uniref:Heparinase II/III-like protein n=1 Tax=Oceaniferula spumae TaxID=2979115 RepID=A0AAT9FRR6_9BACT
MKFLKLLILIALLLAGYFLYPYLPFGKPASGSEATEESLRPIPPALELDDESSIQQLPSPILQGGGPIRITKALEGAAEKVITDDSQRPWVTLGSSKLAKPVSLDKNHTYLVISAPEQGKWFGLVGKGSRNWNNFVQFTHAKDGRIIFRSENRAGAVSTATLKPDQAPAADTPWLIEFHPENGRSNIFINGSPVGSINAAVDFWHFGYGYPGVARLTGPLGELRSYEALASEQSVEIRQRLMAWWGISQDNAFSNNHRQSPAKISANQRTATSGELTLQATSADADIWIGSNESSLPVIDSLPAGYTSSYGREWHLTSKPDTQSTGHFSFQQEDTLSTDFLGKNGFYALLHRENENNNWREVAATSATEKGVISFPAIALTSGIYRLAIAQGEPYQQNPGRIAINGKTIGDTITVQAGDHLQLQSTGALSGQNLVLTETQTGAMWFDGPAEKLDLSLFALRTRTSTFRAHFSTAKGAISGDHTFTINMADSTLYPGLLAQIIRRDNWDAIDATQPPKIPAITWPENFPRAHKDYPAFRTAESIKTPPLDDVTKPWWTAPNYFHIPLPNLTIATTPETIIARKAYHQYPLGDISKHYPVHIQISGKILLGKPGKTHFRLNSNLPGKLTIADQPTTDLSKEIILSTDTPTNAPITLTFANSTELPQLECTFEWKRPGDSEFTPVPGSALVHTVDPNRENALAAITNNFAHRKAKITHFKDDSTAITLLDTLYPADSTTPDANALTKLIENRDMVHKVIIPIADAFLGGRTLHGSPRAAQAVFDLIAARSQFIRENRDQLKVSGFGKTDGGNMRFYEQLRSFLALCENHPLYQTRSLNIRAELSQYAIATCLSRSFFSESHHGANDGYSDDHNLMINFWRAASCLDNPYAWDAAACLQDSQFRFAKGTQESLSSDGLFTFHNVNGRQLHPLGYGTSWYNRVVRRPANASPWEFTPEQYRRLAQYLLAIEWIYYKGTYCWGANGRHNHHRGTANWLASAAANLLKRPEETMHPQTRSELQALHDRVKANADNSIQGHRFFYRSLFTVHRHQDFYIDVKMTSPCVGGIESFAGQIPWNMSFGDGVTTFMRTGDEFKTIHPHNGPNAAYGIAAGYYGKRKSGQLHNFADPPLWLFRALPGTTKLDFETYRPDRYRRGRGTTAGGVSDGTLGHSAFTFDYIHHGAKAHKFYAFTDDGLAVLNTGITATREKTPEDTTVRSNINQCDWKSDIRIIAQDGKITTISLSSDKHDITLPLNQRYWIEQNGIGYLILPTGAEAGPNKPGTLRLQALTRTPYTPVPGLKYTDEHKEMIRKAVKPGYQGKIFHLWIDHGRQVKDASCAYFVCMRADKVDATTWLKSPPITVLSNTESIQALTDTRDHTTHAFFRQPGELKSTPGELLIKSETPAAIMWRPATKSITVQDPRAACTSNPKEMTDAIKLTLGAGLGESQITNHQLQINLPGTNDPDDRFRGRPVTQKIHP